LVLNSGAGPRIQRPAISLAVAIILGIILAEWADILPASMLMLAGFSLVIACGALWRRAEFLAMAFVCLAVFAGIAGWTEWRGARQSGRELLSLMTPSGRLMRLRGKVVGMPEHRMSPGGSFGATERPYTRVVMRVAAVETSRGWMAIRGQLRIRVEGGADDLHGGDEAILLAKVRALRGPRNPGERNLRSGLMRRGIIGEAYVADAGAIRILDRQWFGPGLVSRLRQRLSAGIDSAVPAPQAAIMRCLLLGERHALSREQSLAFQKTGTMHFLAVSGLHVGMLAAMCWWGMLLCGARHRTAAIVVLLIVALYAGLAGFRPSVQRASVMCGVICGAYLLKRRPDFPTSLSMALCLILIIEPAELFSPGLQLSFAAVCGIVAFTRPFARTLFGWRDRIDRLQDSAESGWWHHPLRFMVQQLIAVALVAWLTTLPLTMHYFATIAPCAPLGNVLLIPIVWVVIAFGLPGVLVSLISPFWAKPLLIISGTAAAITDWLSQALAAVPRIALFVPPPSAAWVVACYGAGCLILFRRRLKLNPRHVIMLLLGCGVLYCAFEWRLPARDQVRVTNVDVGEGNCILVQLPQGGTVLFDAGSRRGGSVGIFSIAPALWERGVRRIDALCVSHSDADHYNAVLDIVARFTVGRVILPAHFAREAGADERLSDFLKKLDMLGIPVVTVQAGDHIRLSDRATADVLWPPAEASFSRKVTDNELSLVLRLRSNHGTVLLTGDVERFGASRLLASGQDLTADIMQVPHHGLRNPHVEEIMTRARPSAALVPGGRFMAADSGYRKGQGLLLSTSDCGMISVGLRKGEIVEVETFLRQVEKGE
jgi:competence protein ComEC